VFFVPVCLLALPIQTRRGKLAAVVSGIALAGGAAVITRLIAAPYPYTYSAIFASLPSDPVESLRLALGLMSANFAMIGTGHPLEIHLRSLVFLLTGLLALAVLYQMIHTKSAEPAAAGSKFPAPPLSVKSELLLHLYQLVAIFGLALLLYDFFDWRDFRVLAPHLLFTLSLALLLRRRWLFGFTIAMMIPVLPAALETFSQWSAEHFQADHQAQFVEWQAKWQTTATYQPDAASPWCNTVLLTLPYMYYNTAIALAVDAGMGLSIVLNGADQAFPPKSRYLLLDDEFFVRHQDRLNVTRLTDAPGGALYLNHESACLSPG
jgi:hypothetical protein